MQVRVIALADLEHGHSAALRWSGELAVVPHRGESILVPDEPAAEVVVAVRHDLRDGSVELYLSPSTQGEDKQ